MQSTPIAARETPAIRLALVDDHPLVLEGLRSLLCTLSEVTEVVAFGQGEALLAAARQAPFSAYLLDVELPDIDGFALIEALYAEQPGARIIVNTMHEELWMVRRLAELQPEAVLFKSADPQNLIQAVRTVLRGERYCDPRFTHLLRLSRESTTGHPHERPSRRELDILRAMAQGYSTVEISRLLFISENTVETHRKNLMTKFGARNATDLVLRAISRGYLSLPEE